MFALSRSCEGSLALGNGLLPNVQLGSVAEIIAQELRAAAMRSKAAVHFFTWLTSALGQKRSIDHRTMS